MAGKRAFRLLELPIFVGTIVGIAYMIYVIAFYLGPLILYPSYVDYDPADLVLNRFDLPGGGWPHNFALSPIRKDLVTATPGKIHWITDWDDKERTRIQIQELDVGEQVDAATYSGDGKRVAFSIAEYGKPSAAAKIALYDSRTQELVSKWAMPPDRWLSNLMISHDATLLLTESEEGIEIRKTANGEKLRTLKAPEGRGWRNLTSRGRLVAVQCNDDYKEFTVYESEEPYVRMKLVCSIMAPAGAQLSLPSYSPDGNLFAMRAHPTGEINVYRISDGLLLAKLKRSYQAVCYAFSPSGTFLAISHSDDSVVLWNIDSAKELCMLRGIPFYPIRFLAFGPDDKTLITRDAKATVVWDISRYMN